MKVILETERLVLRQFTVDDAPFILELLNTPTWLQFIGERGVKTLAQAKQYLLDGPIKSYEVNGHGLYLVMEKQNGIPVGACGILRREGLSQPDVGFAFLPAYTSKGYAYEVASKLMEYAKDSLHISPLFAVTTPDNVRSIRLLEKIGFRFVGMTTLPGGNEEMMLFTNEPG
jgi:RimJ/RimL family protein N-acetyltransferase